MKNGSPFLLLIASCFIFTHCEILPDLNPNTSDGALITVIESNDFLTSYDVENNNLNIDFNSDGIFDAQIDYAFGTFDCGNGDLTITRQTRLRYFPGQFLFQSQTNTVYGNNDGGFLFGPETLNGGQIDRGSWKNANVLFDSKNCISVPIGGPCICPESFIGSSFYPDKPKPDEEPQKFYFMTRTNLNGKLHYGWIEFTWTSSQPASDLLERYVVSKFAISNSPGQKILPGQVN